jgi:hypothetical protein
MSGSRENVPSNAIAFLSIPPVGDSRWIAWSESMIRTTFAWISLSTQRPLPLLCCVRAAHGSRPQGLDPDRHHPGNHPIHLFAVSAARCIGGQIGIEAEGFLFAHQCFTLLWLQSGSHRCQNGHRDRATGRKGTIPKGRESVHLFAHT